MRAYVIPRLGRVRLADLTPPRLQSLYTELLASGRRDGSALSARTVLQVHKTFHRALADAVRWRLLPHNPADGARGPRFAAKEMQAWSTEDCRWFLEATSGDRLAPLWLLALNTGMRRGELAGLRWQDIDFDGAALTVTQQRTTADYRVVVSEPKARSRRVITLDATVLNALRAHRRHQREERLAAGPAWEDSGYVFVDEIGRPYHPDRLLRMLRDACQSAGVPPIRSCTTSATPWPPWRCERASTPRSCRSASATRASRSPSTPTPTSRRPCSARPPTCSGSC